MKAVIIAGGLGTRLRPLTQNTPKPIVPVANRPFVVHQIEHLVKHGVDEVILNLHYLSHEIKKILDDGREWGIKIRYSIEEENPKSDSVTISSSLDGGKNWTALAEGLEPVPQGGGDAAQGEFQMTLPLIESDNFLIRVVAMDQAENVGEFSTDPRQPMASRP